MSNLNVYQITQEFRDIENMQNVINEDTGEFLYSNEDIEIKLKELNETKEQKAKNICFLINEARGNSEFLASEIKRLQALKKAEEVKKDRLLKLLDTLADGEKIDTDLFKISYRNSETMQILYEEVVPSEFIRFEKKIDKAELKKAIKNGDVEANEHFYIERNKIIGFK